MSFQCKLKQEMTQRWFIPIFIVIIAIDTRIRLDVMNRFYSNYILQVAKAKWMFLELIWMDSCHNRCAIRTRRRGPRQWDWQLNQFSYACDRLPNVNKHTFPHYNRYITANLLVAVFPAVSCNMLMNGSRGFLKLQFSHCCNNNRSDE